jgi:hypothetical protein
MAKEDLLTLEGQIDEILPDGRFGVMPKTTIGSSPTLPAGCANIASVRL